MFRDQNYVDRGIDATTTIVNGTWYHVVTTCDGDGTNTTLKIYVNGIEENSSYFPNTQINYDNITNLYIGSNIDGVPPGGPDPVLLREFLGKIEEVRIWNDVRTSTEIPENMCKALVGDESGLVAYFNFDNTAGTTLQDFSGNDFNGTLLNMDPVNDWESSSAYNTWLNVVNTIWSTASNWSRASVPVSTDNVGIPDYSGGSHPTLNTSGVCNNLVVGDEVTLTFDYSGSHTINGNAVIIGQTDIHNGSNVTVNKSLHILSGLDIENGGWLTVGN